MKHKILSLFILIGLCMALIGSGFAQKFLQIDIDTLLSNPAKYQNKYVQLKTVFVDSARSSYDQKSRQWITTYQIADSSSDKKVTVRSTKPIKVPSTLKTLKAQVIFNPATQELALNDLEPGGDGPIAAIKKMIEEEPWKIVLIVILGILLILAIAKLIQEYLKGGEEERPRDAVAEGGTGRKHVLPVASSKPPVSETLPNVKPKIQSQGKVVIAQNYDKVNEDPSTRHVIKSGGEDKGRKNKKGITRSVSVTNKSKKGAPGETIQVFKNPGVLTEQGGSQRHYPLEAVSIEIGRDVGEKPNIEFPEQYDWISRKHARIEYSWKEKKYVLHNLSEKNPIEVNGNIVDKLGVELKDGDVITLGKTKMTFNRPDLQVS